MIIAKISEATWAIVLLMTLVTFPSNAETAIKLIDARSGNEVKKYEDKTKIDVNLPANHLFLIEAR